MNALGEGRMLNINYSIGELNNFDVPPIYLWVEMYY